VTLDATGAVRRFDAAADRLAARGRGRPHLDRVMYAASELGDFSLIWHLASVVTALVDGEAGERRALRLSTALAGESILVNGLLKSLTRRARPAAPVEPRPHRLRTPRTSSFPSGHASAAACAVVLLADADRPVRTAAWSVLGVVVATSRVHVGIHHASDVLGGAVVGAWLGRAVRRRWPVR